MQARRNVLSSRYPVPSENEMVDLAALLLQEELGDLALPFHGPGFLTCVCPPDAAHAPRRGPCRSPEDVRLPASTQREQWSAHSLAAAVVGPGPAQSDRRPAPVVAAPRPMGGPWVTNANPPCLLQALTLVCRGSHVRSTLGTDLEKLREAQGADARAGTAAVPPNRAAVAVLRVHLLPVVRQPAPER